MSRKNHHYLSELKYQAVGEYLKRQKTLDAVCKKYGILSDWQLRNWIKMYNSHTELIKELYRRQPYDQREKYYLRGTNRTCKRVH